jgi:osmoprotectant transport system ATP-binding protein
MADRIVVMNAGRVVQAGTPLELLSRPADPYVERLLDTHDAVRRLQLIACGDAMAAPDTSATQGSIDAARSLREALSSFLEGATRIAVTREGAVIGSLAFDDVRRAIARIENAV